MNIEKNFAEHIFAIVESLSEAMKALLPENQHCAISFNANEDEPKITLEAFGLEVIPGVFIGKSIKGDVKLPGFEIGRTVYFAGSYHEPPDWDYVEIETVRNWNQVDAAVIKAIRATVDDNYWTYIAERGMADMWAEDEAAGYI